ncbi:MAG: 50S ribosomal protein L11 methyltransferase [Clostridia bacterium]|nr:50S ribosomal protein L11 methyltransferase [Clostridia bacterium]MBQ9408812.1 50S ribosomal protein L11 methyltransferase [Clostridia bacterium]
MDWMKLTVLTTTLASDIVSQLLIDAGSAGTVIEDKNDVFANQRPEGQWDIIDEEIARRIGDDVKVSGFYPMDERASDTLATVRERLTHLSELAPGVDLGKLELQVGGVDDEDWAESWKHSYKPFRLGRHIVIRPGWEEYKPEPEDKVITIDPGMAFGTGTHETTGMCVSLIENYVKPGYTCMDIGTGTGILAIASALMGAQSVLASDIDPMAVRVAKENVEINGLSDKINCVCGNLLEIADKPVDLVSANIIADVIISICADVRKFIKPGGVFICSGIAREREDETIRALKAAGYKRLDVRNDGEWTAIACFDTECTDS